MAPDAFAQHIKAWLDGELTAVGEPGAAAVAEHVAVCPACTETVRDYRDIAGQVETLGAPAAAVGRALGWRIVEQLRGERETIRMLQRVVAVAAVVLLASLGWLVTLSPGPRGAPVGDLATARDSTLILLLRDGWEEEY